jgi:hypothetical protein
VSHFNDLIKQIILSVSVIGHFADRMGDLPGRGLTDTQLFAENNRRYAF